MKFSIKDFISKVSSFFRKTPNTDTFQAVESYHFFHLFQYSFNILKYLLLLIPNSFSIPIKINFSINFLFGVLTKTNLVIYIFTENCFLLVLHWTKNEVFIMDFFRNCGFGHIYYGTEKIWTLLRSVKSLLNSIEPFIHSAVIICL